MVDPDNPIVQDIQTVLDFLSVGVGIVVVGVIIWGGIQYAMAGDSPEAIGKAKSRIVNGLIALLAFIFLFAFVQWLVPGGIFGGGQPATNTPRQNPSNQTPNTQNPSNQSPTNPANRNFEGQ